MYCTDASQRPRSSSDCAAAREEFRFAVRPVGSLPSTSALLAAGLCDGLVLAHALAISTRARHRVSVSVRLLRSIAAATEVSTRSLPHRAAHAALTGTSRPPAASVPRPSHIIRAASGSGYIARSAMPKAKAAAKRKFLPFDYDALTADVDCRANPHLYRIGAGTTVLLG